MILAHESQFSLSFPLFRPFRGPGEEKKKKDEKQKEICRVRR
jgi:hypothetical protein